MVKIGSRQFLFRFNKVTQILTRIFFKRSVKTWGAHFIFLILLIWWIWFNIVGKISLNMPLIPASLELDQLPPSPTIQRYSLVWRSSTWYVLWVEAFIIKWFKPKTHCSFNSSLLSKRIIDITSRFCRVTSVSELVFKDYLDFRRFIFPV